MCNVRRSSYNSRLKRRKTAEAKAEKKKAADKHLKESIRGTCKQLAYVPGARSMKTFLSRDCKLHVGRKRISKLMREMNLRPSVPHKDAYKGQAYHDHICTAPDNLVNQNFRIAPRKIICTDVTYLYYGKLRSLLYLCVFKDAYTKEILGWSMDNEMTVALIKSAYDMMMKNHGKELSNPEVLIHSDQGSQYMSTTFKKILSDDHFLQSVSARANSQDNAPVESYFSRLKTALLDLLKMCRNDEQAIAMTNGYINSYNTKHYQYNLAGLTPHEFYLYCQTGIYPCDNYYGVKGTALRSLESIVRTDLIRAEEKARKHREIYAERSRVSRLLKKDPRQMTIDDQNVLRRRINKLTEHKRKITEYIEKLVDVLLAAIRATEYMDTMTEEQRAKFKDPKEWRNCDQLSYIYEMGGMF